MVVVIVGGIVQSDPKLDNTYDSDKIIKKERQTLEKYNMSDVIYNSSFYEYYNINSNSLYLTLKCKVLTPFYNELNKVYRLIPQKDST